MKTSAMTRSAVRDDHGYSIVELLVVMGVIAILIGIALPTFLGAQHRAEDQKAKADLRNALAAALTHFAEAGAWDDFDAAEALLIEPTVAWIDGGAPTPGQISIQVHAGMELLIVRRSTSGDFFCVAQIADSPATTRGSGATFADVATVPECTGGW
jgi:type IV pilus assembly protein PilA